jgi:hypothetical protein
LIFLRTKQQPTSQHALRRIDFVGNAIFIPSMIAILFGLSMGGVKYPWKSYHIVVPLVLGTLGWIAFHVHQASGICKEPSVPTRLFSNRTSATAYGLTFISSIIVQMITYFFPVYLQAVKGKSPLQAGVQFLPFAGSALFFAVLAGTLLSKTGLYRPLHWASFVLSAIGFGIFTLLDENSSKAAWVCFQIVASAGAGIVMSVLLPACMAALPESDVASATAAYSFLRTFGYVWGVTIPSITFNDQFNKHLHEIGDETLRPLLANGAAYAYASQQSLQQLSETTKAQVLGVYVKSLKTVWQVGIAFSVLAFFLVFLERHVPLRKELDTEFGLQEGEKDTVEVEKGIETKH